MNPNIDVIHKHLWAVSFAAVEAGWIHGLSFNRERHNPYAEITQKGEIILNKDDPELCRLMQRMLIDRIMTETDKAIAAGIADLKNIGSSSEWNKEYSLLLFLYELEQVRRKCKRRKKWWLW